MFYSPEASGKCSVYENLHIMRCTKYVCTKNRHEAIKCCIAFEKYFNKTGIALETDWLVGFQLCKLISKRDIY
jgi:hypothetical protein